MNLNIINSVIFCRNDFFVQVSVPFLYDNFFKLTSNAGLLLIILNLATNFKLPLNESKCNLYNYI